MPKRSIGKVHLENLLFNVLNVLKSSSGGTHLGSVLAGTCWLVRTFNEGGGGVIGFPILS